MLYALIGSGLLGALATAFLLWRKSVVETELAGTRGQLTSAQDKATRAIAELNLQASTYQDQLASNKLQLDTLRKQRDEALDQLAKTGTPGSLTDLLRNQVGASSNNPKPTT